MSPKKAKAELENLETDSCVRRTTSLLWQIDEYTQHCVYIMFVCSVLKVTGPSYR
jgi:hypothetical protein